MSQKFLIKKLSYQKINLKITKGEAVAIIGPNSSGKTVLGRLIASLIKPTSGIVEYNFTKGDAYTSIGFQFEHTNWPEGFKVREIVNLYVKIFAIHDEAWLEKLSNLFDINSRFDRTLNSCGSSWLKLFSLYLALVHKPELVILDEVSNSIGLDMKQKVVEFLKWYKKEYKATFIIISPDEMLFEICDQVIVLQNGLIASEDEISKLPQPVSYKAYITEIMRALETETVTLKPDPIFQPILKNYLVAFESFNEEYQKFMAIKNLQTAVETSNSLTMLKNYWFHTEILHQALLKVASTALDKKILMKLDMK
ncbi:ABC transporter ATP-binding protein [Spiroplasma clarkii]|nr:ABC transporter ATP-binding protein [Spiroplasma clarkii]